MNFEQIRRELNQEITDSVGRLSAEFMELSKRLKSDSAADDSARQLDKLFRQWMLANQVLTGYRQKMEDICQKLTERELALNEEKRRLEVLYTSGISFSSELEMKSLLSKAIDTVINELNADAGFIVLVNEQGEIDSIVARNMNPEQEVDAKDLSTSVIRNTLSNSKPTQTIDIDKFIEESKRGSILRLGIRSVLCVPLISVEGVLGAVYLDRRKTELPFEDADLIFVLSFARQIIQGMQISREISLLESRLLQESQMKFEDLRRDFDCEAIIGSSTPLFEVLRMGARIAPTNASVLILGENGTGKELFARAIHRNSRRAAEPFVAINCGAIPADLLESELFGYEPGAFTGAVKSKPGKFELACRGTLFLDEIGELSVQLQAKLLRVLQTLEIERLGGISPTPIDVRILAATNRNLAGMVRQGSFREDLYYRLKVIEVTLPSLRSRRDDIAELANFFLKKHGNGNTRISISDPAMEILENYSWPGNIRELENVILRGVVLSKSDTIQPNDLPPEFSNIEIHMPRVAPGSSLADAESAFRRNYILKILKDTSSKAEAARILGVNRTHFYRMLTQLEIEH